MSKRSTLFNSAFACIVVLAILLPSMHSFAHSLEDHNHYDLCDNPFDVHVHEQQLDCDLDLITFKKEFILVFAKTNSFSSPTYFYNPTGYVRDITTRDIAKEPSRGPPTLY